MRYGILVLALLVVVPLAFAQDIDEKWRGSRTRNGVSPNNACGAMM